MTDKETIAVYDAKAAEYVTLTRRDTPDPQLLEFIAALPNDGPVLDLGCGPGVAAAQIAATGREVQAWDASVQMVALAAKQPGVVAKHARFEDLAALPARSLTGVWANFSLLHATPEDLPRYLSDIAAALQAGGVFHIGLKLGTGAERDRIGRFYTYVEEEELLQLLTDAGLSPGKITKGEGAGLSGDIEPWITVLSHA